MTIICFSHLRWNFVYQRPQHLLSRFAQQNMVYYVEEPVWGEMADHHTSSKNENVTVIVPCLSYDSRDNVDHRIETIIKGVFKSVDFSTTVFWYYTPMALKFTSSFNPALVVYDCMDELGNFKFAPPELHSLELELFNKAAIVFTGGNSLYNVKKSQHHNVYSFPSAIDKRHFAQARQTIQEPEDQAKIPHPRIGFFGVIDERLDIDLLDKLALDNPDWHLVIIGPVVKVDPQLLPRYANIHYLGSKTYPELPVYLSGWDVALIPFAINESTTFISPTKTPEYLAGGKPVVSTPITDVIHPYEDEQLVHIAKDANEFGLCIKKELAKTDKSQWLKRVDQFLSNISWDATHLQMNNLIIKLLEKKESKNYVRLPDSRSRIGRSGVSGKISEQSKQESSHNR